MSRRRKRQVVEAEEIDAPIIISSLQDTLDDCSWFQNMGFIQKTEKAKRKGESSCSSRSSRRHARQEGKLYSDMFDFYLGHLWESFPEDKRSNFMYLDCLWFSHYIESCDQKVLAWIKKKHIFSKKYVFVPIVLWSHWNLLIFCNLDQSLELKTSAPCMLLLDSLQIADPRRFEPPIRKFVSDIFVAEERPESSKLISKIPLLVPKVPQQRDDKECGHFVLYFLSLFVENAPENFSATEGYPYFMNEGWFAHEDLDCFCEKLKSYNQ